MLAGPSPEEPAEETLEDPDLTPVERECSRCGVRQQMRFAGVCDGCREQLHARFPREVRNIEVEAYEPKMNVTPNGVATKAD